MLAGMQCPDLALVKMKHPGLSTQVVFKSNERAAQLGITRKKSLRKSMSNTIEYKILKGDEISRYLEELVQLRIRTFKEWPYLYEANKDEEYEYLGNFITSNESVVVLALVNDQIVGALTGIVLADSVQKFTELFNQHNLDPYRYFYLSEAMIIPSYRGQKLIFSMYNEMKQAAPRKPMCFAMIERSEHSRSFDLLALKYGFEYAPHLQCILPWKEITSHKIVPHRLTFWVEKSN